MPNNLLTGTPQGLLILLAVFFFLAGVLRGFNGFGSSLLSVPALSFLLDPTEAVAIATIAEIPVVFLLLPSVHSHASATTTLPMIATFVICVPLGAAALTSIDPTPMKIGLCVFVLVMLGILAKQDRITTFLHHKTLIAAGALAGFSQGLTAIASPIFATAIIARGEDMQTTRANIIALAAALITLSLISFGWFGILTLQTITTAIIMSIPFALGVCCGQALFNRASHLNLQPVFMGLVALTAFSTLTQELF